MKDFQDPILALNQQSISVIDSAIQAYLALLKARRPIPVETIQRISSIHLKFTPLLTPGGFPEGNALFLSHDELQLIREALGGFIERTRQVIPPSNQREDVLQELEKLLKYIITYIPAKPGKDL